MSPTRSDHSVATSPINFQWNSCRIIRKPFEVWDDTRDRAKGFWVGIRESKVPYKNCNKYDYHQASSKFCSHF